MAYEQNRDPWPVNSDGRGASFQASKAYLLTGGMIGTAELPKYAKALAIYVPDGVTAAVTMVYSGDDDAGAVTRKFGPGNHLVPAFIRRITAVTGAGVEIHIETD
jgi:hypothetical protein